MSLSLLIALLVICVVLEGFFAGTEMALVNANKPRLATLTTRGSRWAIAALHLVKHPAQFFSTTLLGTNLCTVAGSVLTAFYIINHYGEERTIFALLLWPVTLIFGELVPKSLYQYYADRLVPIVAPLLLGVAFIFYPVVWIVSKFTDLLLSGVKMRFGKEPLLSREELELFIQVGDETSSDMKPVERTMISRIFDLAEKRVANIKTPLIDVVALPDTATREEAQQIMEKTEHSRIPVYSENIYNIIGVLTNTDFLLGAPQKSVHELMKPPYYVSEEMSLDELLLSLKRREEWLAVAVDEYGAATGIVTSEDLLEEIVGEIRDEHDVAPQLYQRLGTKRFLVSGRMEVKAANEKLKLAIPEGTYETVAGFIVSMAGRILRVGEVFSYQNLQMTIRHATDRVIQEVEIVVK